MSTSTPTLSSGYVSQLVEAARKCAIQQSIAQARRCEPVPVPVQQGPTAGQLDILQVRIAANTAASTAPLPIPTKTESRRIQERVNEANQVWDPAKIAYRMPLPVPCPPIPAEYLRAGEPLPRPRFECYDSVVGFI
jgi:hypothetical protein